MRCLLAAAILALLAGCGGDSDGGASVVATTSVVGDLARNVAGGAYDVETIVDAEVDPHDFEPRPSDAAALARAKLVLRSGGELDEWLAELADDAGSDARTLTLLDAVRPLGDDPHWWHDPRNAIRAAEAIARALPRSDGAEAYARELRALDRELAACFARVPAAQRKIVTTHDSLGYLARRYDIEVVGAVIPSLSTQAQPSAKDVDALVEQIRAEDVQAVFPEAEVSRRLEEAISREAGAEVGEELWTDSLGPEGSGAETYVAAMRHNTRALARGMSGGRVSCGSTR